MPHILSIQPVLMVRDVERAIAFYATLDFTLKFRDHPTIARYVGVIRDGIELHLQWHDAAEWNYPNDRPTYRVMADDVDALAADFRARGLQDHMTAVRDTPWGTREFHIQDPDRNGLQFYRHL